MLDNYYQAQLDHETEVRAREREQAREVINATASSAERQMFLEALGLLEA